MSNLLSKKTVASCKSRFTTLVDDLSEIINRETGIRDKALDTVQAANAEINAAEKFQNGLNKLLNGD